MRAALAVTLFATLALGCDPTVKIGDPDGGAPVDGGGAGDGGTDGGTNAELEAFCQQFIDALFDLDVRCGNTTAEWSMLTRAEIIAVCVGTSPTQQPQQSVRVLNTAQLATCIRAIENFSCLGVFPPYDCQTPRLIVGTLTEGGACGDDTACVPSLYCDFPDTCPGQCKPRIAVGQPVISSQRCVEGAGPLNGTCQPLPGLNMSCAPTGGSMERRACAAPYTCLPSELCGVDLLLAENAACSEQNDRCGRGLQCFMNTCQPVVGLNGSCAAGRRCKEGLDCTNGTCVAAVASITGGPCDAQRSCLGNTFCNVVPGTTAGTCAPRRMVGGTCTSVGNGNECWFGLHCTATATAAGVCVLPAAAGAPCTYDTNAYYQCRGDTYCTGTMSSPAGTCALKKPGGASCTTALECQGQCVGGTCTTPYFCYVP
ncbi:MAG: hypothetical protein JNK82_05650 [Myxococcaceae bacterium]|nr:hypothetical protein [Myxococcaceae bacterium]